MRLLCPPSPSISDDFKAFQDLIERTAESSNNSKDWFSMPGAHGSLYISKTTWKATFSVSLSLAQVFYTPSKLKLVAIHWRVLCFLNSWRDPQKVCMGVLFSHPSTTKITTTDAFMLGWGIHFQDLISTSAHVFPAVHHSWTRADVVKLFYALY